MKTVNVNAINIYQFDELSDNGKIRAINEHTNFLLSVYSDDDYDESFNMTYAEYENTLRDEDIIESIEANEYYFYKDGELTQCVSYFGKHPRAGETILTHDGVEYVL